MRTRLLAAVVVAGVVSSASAQGTVDAKQLVGYWTGRWKSSSGSSDNLYLDVKTADGESVQGTIMIAVTTPSVNYYNRDVPFSGTYDGGELRIWLPPAVGLALRPQGDRLLGSIQGPQTLGAVELERAR